MDSSLRRSLQFLSFLLLPLVAYCSFDVPAVEFDRDAWLRDYALMKQTLEQSYSNLAWFGSIESGLDLPALDQKTLASLEAATSDQDAQRALLTFVESFHDGHFSLLRPRAPQHPAAEKPAEPVFSRKDPVGGCGALHYGAVPRAAFSASFDSLPGFELIAEGNGVPFRAGVLTEGNPGISVGIVRIPEFESNYRAFCLEAWGQNDMWGQDGKLLRGALDRTVDQRWYDALASLLGKFKARSVAAVLIDIGDNSGGGDSGDIAARLFTAIQLHSASLWMSQNRAASETYFDEQIAELRRALKFDAQNKLVAESLSWFTAQKEKLADPCPMDWVWHERRTWDAETCRRIVEAGSAGGPLAYLSPNSVADVRIAQRLHWPASETSLWSSWTGPLYVLTDNKTYSSAEMFAAVLQNNGAAKMVGTQTGGDGCGFMNHTEPLVLPHSGLRFRIPNCVRIRADGTDEVAGIKPDLPIPMIVGEDSKARAGRIFSAVRSDLTIRLRISSK